MSADGNKLRADLARLVASEFKGFAYAGSHSFTVAKVYAGGRCDLSPVRAGKFQPLSKVDQWPCVGGAVTTPVVGSIAVVEFRDWDSRQPMITRFQPPRQTGGKPVKIELDADEIEFGGSGAAPLALAAAVQTFANNVVLACAANVPPITITPLSGAATTKAKGV